MLQWLSKMILKIWGFKIKGHNPNKVDKKLFIVMPHTSNMDFPLGMLVKTAMNIETNFLAKHTLFRWPIKWFLLRWGFVPVDRSKNNGLTAQMVTIFNSQEKIAFGVAPEGTRRNVAKLRTGFYHIARQANVPIILVTMDWKNKQVHFGEPYYLSSNKEMEIIKIENYYAGIHGFRKKRSFKMPS